jgi:hypothetical protein
MQGKEGKAKVARRRRMGMEGKGKEGKNVQYEG